MKKLKKMKKTPMYSMDGLAHPGGTPVKKGVSALKAKFPKGSKGRMPKKVVKPKMPVA